MCKPVARAASDSSDAATAGTPPPTQGFVTRGDGAPMELLVKQRTPRSSFVENDPTVSMTDVFSPTPSTRSRMFFGSAEQNSESDQSVVDTPEVNCAVTVPGTWHKPYREALRAVPRPYDLLSAERPIMSTPVTSKSVRKLCAEPKTTSSISKEQNVGAQSSHKRLDYSQEDSLYRAKHFVSIPSTGKYTIMNPVSPTGEEVSCSEPSTTAPESECQATVDQHGTPGPLWIPLDTLEIANELANADLATASSSPDQPKRPSIWI